MSKPASAHHAAPRAGGAILAAFCASLVGIGLARFAYTPLLPAIIHAHWFAPSAAIYLGAANLAGYLLGALSGRPLAQRLRADWILRGMMVLATLSFFACALRFGFVWFFVWRLLSGISGGALMVLAAITVLPHVPPARRGLASGVIFMGIGVGAAASGTLVPLLLKQGVSDTWIVLGVIALILTIVAWALWPQATSQQAAQVAHSYGRARIPLRVLYVGYGLTAFGLVPHMLFLVDFVVRGLHLGLHIGAAYWVLFGIGAIIGPLMNGMLADRFGFGPMLRAAYLIEAAGVLLPLLGGNTIALIVSSLVMGAFTPGIVPLALGRVHELVGHDAAAQRAAWTKATASYALMQAVAAYGFSFLLAGTGDYALLFIGGAVALILAFLIDVTVVRRPAPVSGTASQS